MMEKWPILFKDCCQMNHQEAEQIFETSRCGDDPVCTIKDGKKVRVVADHGPTRTFLVEALAPSGGAYDLG